MANKLQSVYPKILVPLDGSATSLRGLAEAVKLAKRGDVQLQLLHVVNELVIGSVETAPVYLDRLIEDMRASGRAILHTAERIVRDSGLQAQSVLLESVGNRAADQIVEQARQWPADLIVMGTHGRRGLSRLALSSDAELVVRSAPVPVLLVRGGDA